MRVDRATARTVVQTVNGVGGAGRRGSRRVLAGTAVTQRMEDRFLAHHRTMTRVAGLSVVAAFVFSACSSSGSSSAPSAAASAAPPASAAASAAAPSAAASAGGSPAAAAGPSAALIAAAQAEGNLTTIALPRDWCNYGAAIDGFSKKYNIKILLYRTPWENPHPDKRVATIDYLSSNDTAAAPFCVAITAESK